MVGVAQCGHANRGTLPIWTSTCTRRLLWVGKGEKIMGTPIVEPVFWQQSHRAAPRWSWFLPPDTINQHGLLNVLSLPYGQHKFLRYWTFAAVRRHV